MYDGGRVGLTCSPPCRGSCTVYLALDDFDDISVRSVQIFNTSQGEVGSRNAVVTQISSV